MPPSTISYQMYLTLDGRIVAPELASDLEQVTVESSLHLPDVATLIFQDTRLRWINDNVLLPGKTLKVEAGIDESHRDVIFDGEIVEVEADFHDATQRLVVRAFDRLHRLGRGRHIRTFQNVTDGDMFNSLVAEAGLSGTMDATTQVYEHVFQANETNLAFLQRRAVMLGYLLYADGQQIRCRAPANEEAQLDLKWGDQGTLITFRPRISTIGQFTTTTVRSWDPGQKQVVLGRAQSTRGVNAINETRSGGSFAHSAFNLNAETFVTDRSIHNQAEADALARAEMSRHDSRYVEADGLSAGEPKLVAGTKVSISGVGERFSGTYLVTSATHTYGVADDNYQVAFTVSGMNPVTLLSQLAPPHERQIEAGLTIGLVTDNQDPQGLGRVKLKYPWLTDDHTSHWARVAAPGAGADRGIQFMPEVNDEVLVGFEHGDMQHPFVIGGLWNGRDATPLGSSAVSGGGVQQRTLRTREGHEILLDDESSGGITISVGGSSPKYLIKLDLGNNVVTITSDGDIKLKANQNIELEATGDLILKGRSITAEAQSDMNLKGISVKLDATASAELKGGGSMKVSSTGIMELQGSLIKLN